MDAHRSLLVVKYYNALVGKFQDHVFQFQDPHMYGKPSNVASALASQFAHFCHFVGSC